MTRGRGLRVADISSVVLLQSYPSVFRIALYRLVVYVSTTDRPFLCVFQVSDNHITIAKGAPIMLRDWTKLWEEDVERV